MIGRNLAELIVNPAAVHEYLARIRERGRDQGWMEAINGDGESVFLQYHNVLVEPEDREAYVLGHAQDVTALVRTKQELGVARDQLDRLLAVSPSMIYSARATG